MKTRYLSVAILASFVLLSGCSKYRDYMDSGKTEAVTPSPLEQENADLRKKISKLELRPEACTEGATKKEVEVIVQKAVADACTAKTVAQASTPAKKIVTTTKKSFVPTPTARAVAHAPAPVAAPVAAPAAVSAVATATATIAAPAAVVAAPAPASVIAAPPTGACTTDCKPEAKVVIADQKAKVCGIAVQASLTDKTIVARLQLDENPDYPGKLRIAKVASFEGAAQQVSRSPWNHSTDCNVDQATVYQNWPAVVAKFNLPADCIPNKKG